MTRVGCPKEKLPLGYLLQKKISENFQKKIVSLNFEKCVGGTDVFIEKLQAVEVCPKFFLY